MQLYVVGKALSEVSYYLPPLPSGDLILTDLAGIPGTQTALESDADADIDTDIEDQESTRRETITGTPFEPELVNE